MRQFFSKTTVGTCGCRECTSGGWRGGEDESMQEEAEEGRRPLFRKSENHPLSQEAQ